MPGAGGQQPQRTTFRPPWVKEGPPPIPMPTAPWTLNSRRESNTAADDAPAFTKVTLKSVPKPADQKSTETKSATPSESRKTSKISIVPSQPKSDKISSKTPAPTPLRTRENGRQESTSSKPQLERQVRLERSKSRGDQIPLSKSESTSGAPTLSKSASRANIPPPPPPRPPPPPPSRNILKNLPPLSEKQQKTIEMLKSRPRKRPDWACMMKEVESGKKLRHVTCNDRSAPLIERKGIITKVAEAEGDAHFVFDSEKSNVHNKLLKQIEEGVKLKSVKTNDRSKPMLQGLRKLRRQLTIEEQIQKAEQAPIDEVIPDEMDDIDAVRDDLQSTKQMLALELRNKEALERENKKLQAKILNLEVELERERSQKTVQEHKQQDQKLSESLKKEAELAKKNAERLEEENSHVTEERDKALRELEDVKRMYANLEKRMKAGMALAGCPSAKDVARIASQKSVDKPEPEESEEDEEESSEDDSDEDDDPKVVEEKRQQREIKLMKTKVRNFKDKITNSKKERVALKGQIKQQQDLLKQEKKKFKHLQKEVDKMAKLMADAADDDDEDNEDEEEEEEEETESEEESESEESEDEDSESDDERAPLEKRKNKLQTRVKTHEGRLSALKKGNYLLKAQVDRLKDDLSKQREESLTLQEDLDSVLAELG